jgi:hypothetical protein
MRSTASSHPKSWLALAFALGAAACSGSEGLMAPNHGRVRFLLDGADGVSLATSGPVGASTADLGPAVDTGTVDPVHPDSASPQPRPLIKAATVTITGIVAVSVAGEFVEVDMDLPATVDVLRLESGRQIQLPDGELPVGAYDKVVVAIGAVQVTLRDDTKITIDPPGSGWTAVSPLCPPVEIEESGDATVALTLEVRNSFFFQDGRFHFAPRFRPPLFGCPPVPAPLVP